MKAACTKARQETYMNLFCTAALDLADAVSKKAHDKQQCSVKRVATAAVVPCGAPDAMVYIGQALGSDTGCVQWCTGLGTVQFYYRGYRSSWSQPQGTGPSTEPGTILQRSATASLTASCGKGTERICTTWNLLIYDENFLSRINKKPSIQHLWWFHISL
jgi:hypothetical protein